MVDQVADPVPTDSVQRSVTLDVFVPDEQRQSILNSIRKYRAVCRQVYAALLLGQVAGATLKDDADKGPSLKPDGDRSKVALGVSMNNATVTKGEKVKGQGQEYKITIGTGLAYELREYVRRELWPTSLSYVWDAIRRDVNTVWLSLDPEHTKAKRGWLALQGARGIAQFNWRGIGIPQATGRPKLDKDTITLKWDTEIGPTEFKLGKLDTARWYAWKCLRDGIGGHKAGTLYLNERDGRLKITISYSKPALACEVDPQRTCTVTVVGDGEVLFRLAGPDAEQTYDTISGADLLGWLARLQCQKIARETERAACGAPSRPWGRRKGWKAAQRVIGNLTRQRENGVKTHNHDWARRIVTRALAWRCGKIELKNVPEKLLADHPWNWSQFRDFVKYKASERGMELC